jgi:hypothetical protein
MWYMVKHRVLRSATLQIKHRKLVYVIHLCAEQALYLLNATPFLFFRLVEHEPFYEF